MTNILKVVIPSGGKKSPSPNKQITTQLTPECTISTLWIEAVPDQNDKRGKLLNATLQHLVAWLLKHGGQLEEFLVMMDEKQEECVLNAILGSPNLKLKKLLFSTADFTQDKLQKLPATLEVFAAHLKPYSGKLSDLPHLPHLRVLAVRWYGRETHGHIPNHILRHPSLAVLIADADRYTLEPSDAPLPDDYSYPLRIVALLGRINPQGASELIKLGNNLRHLSIRRYNCPFNLFGNEIISWDVKTLVNLHSLELGMDNLRVSNVHCLDKLASVCLFGYPASNPPPIPHHLDNGFDQILPEDSHLRPDNLIFKRVHKDVAEEAHVVQELGQMQHMFIVNPSSLITLCEAAGI